MNALGENWDTHGDGTGELSRRMFGQAIMPSLRVFLERTLAMIEASMPGLMDWVRTRL